MFPYMKRCPTEILQFRILTAVARNIVIQFGRPPRRVVLRGGAMFGATVPETTVDKNRYSRSGQRNIGRSRQGSNMQPIPQAEAVQLTTKRQLGGGICARHQLHLPPDHVIERPRPTVWAAVVTNHLITLGRDAVDPNVQNQSLAKSETGDSQVLDYLRII